MKTMNETRWNTVNGYLKPIARLFEMDGVTEIMVNRYNSVYIERYGKKEAVADSFQSEEAVYRLLRQIGKALDQPLDKETYPLLDGRLACGSRISAALSPVTGGFSSFSIRVKPRNNIDIAHLLRDGAITEEMTEFLKKQIEQGGNGVISGGTGSGKTTLMNVLIGFIPEDERVLTVEDTRELLVANNQNMIAFESPVRRDSFGDEERQQIDMARLVEAALRFNPDRIIIGEIRQPRAAKAFSYAINTGHKGVCTTLHANSNEDAISRLVHLEMESSLNATYELVRKRILSNINFLCHVTNIKGVGRRITQITEIKNNNLEDKFTYDYIK